MSGTPVGKISQRTDLGTMAALFPRSRWRRFLIIKVDSMRFIIHKLSVLQKLNRFSKLKSFTGALAHAATSAPPGSVALATLTCRWTPKLAGQSAKTPLRTL